MANFNIEVRTSGVVSMDAVSIETYTVVGIGAIALIELELRLSQEIYVKHQIYGFGNFSIMRLG